MQNKKYIDADKAYDFGTLSDWFQNSVDNTEPPIWSDEHLDELLEDFLVIPKDTPAADVVEVVMCKNCKYFKRFNAGYQICTAFDERFVLDVDYCSDGECRERKEQGNAE